jgi:hypothetical protein
MSSSQTPFSQDGLEDNFTSQKRLLRQLDERVVRQKVTKSMVREAIKLYDLEKSYKGQSLEALSELERLFKINDIEWPSEDVRMAMISKKVAISLRRILKSYGYELFSFYAEDHKCRLEISPPRPGQKPPKLPKWLQIPYLVPVKGIGGRLIFDRCANPCIQRGDKLFQRDGNIMVQVG